MTTLRPQYKQKQGLDASANVNSEESSKDPKQEMIEINFKPDVLGFAFMQNIIYQVQPDTQAHKAGICVGWTIRQINGKSSSDSNDIYQTITKAREAKECIVILFQKTTMDKKTLESFQKSLLKKKAVKKTWINKVTLPFLLCATVGISYTKSELEKLMANKLQEHMFFINILRTFVLTGVFFIVATLRTSPLSSEHTSFPKSKIARIAIFDTLAIFLVMIGSTKTPDQMQSLLLYSSIPITMFVKWAWLGVAPKSLQANGVLCIMFGAVYSMNHKLLEETHDFTSNIIFYLFILVSCVPASISSVYKEIALTAHNIDDYHLNAWVTLFKCGLTFFCFPLYTLPILQDDPVEIDQLFSKLYHGVVCIIGRVGEDNCEMGWWYVTVCIGCSFIYIVLFTKLITHAGATMMFAASTLTLPITNLVFNLRKVMGTQTENFNLSSLIALLFICMGIIIYRMSTAKEHTD